MKYLFTGLTLFAALWGHAQTQSSENIFIVTTDGFRWQEIFNGADSALINNPRFVHDIPLTKQLYWHPSPAERRKKLLPFFWNVLSTQGQLYGNRTRGSKVAVKNIYKISYPGYNELLTGYADPLPVLNAPQYNGNISVLEYLNALPAYSGQVAAFSSWNVFPCILNNKRNRMVQNSGYQPMADDGDEALQVSNAVQDSLVHKYHTRYDALTFFTAHEYIKTHHPKVVFIGLGETDEYAHQGRYDLYLQQAATVDKMLQDLWYFIQTDSVYRNRSTIIISTDHGRGKYGDKWTSHHTFIRGSGEIWLGLIGKGIAPTGEMEGAETLYQNQVAATVGQLLGEPFKSDKRIGKAVNLPLVPAPIATVQGVPLPVTLYTSANK